MRSSRYDVSDTRGTIDNYISDFSGTVPTGEIRDSEKYMRYMPMAMDRVRDTCGFDIKLLHDVHHRPLPREAAEFARENEQYRLFWLEAPSPAENQKALKLVRQHSTIPIAIGEVFNSLWDCNQLVEKESIDFNRVAVAYAGGITSAKRIMHLAGMHNLRTGLHGAPSHSPVSMVSKDHLNAWAPNFGIQEYLVLGTPEYDALFPSRHEMTGGLFHVSDEPGLGVDFDESESMRYSDVQRFHLVARLQDGTVWNY